MKKSTVLLALLALLIAGCSSKSDKDYYETAEKNMKENKIIEAVKSYEQVISEFPDSKFALEATMKLATIYQNKMIDSLSDMQSYQKAIDLFKQVYNKYPASDQAPTALFMAGFVEANNLSNYNEATKTYQLFLDKYPTHKLALSAKEELNNMGLPPEEILNRKNKKGT